MTILLVPVDGSQYSVEAVRTAIALGKELRVCNLHILTVVTPLAQHMSQYLTPEKIAAFYQEEREKAIEPVKALLASSGLEHHEVWQPGAVAKTIVDYAHKHAVNHIVMGSRGFGAVSTILLGSVSNKVLSMTNIPVTLVKLPDESVDEVLDLIGHTPE